MVGRPILPSIGLLLIIGSPTVEYLAEVWTWIKGNHEALFVVGGFLALGLAVWRSLAADQQAKAASRQVGIAEASIALTRETLVQSQFQAAIELLGSEIVAVRLSAVTVLAGLMVRFPDEYHVRVMRLFVACLTYPRWMESKQTPIASSDDIREIIDVINRTGDKERAREKAMGFDLEQRLSDTHFRLHRGKIMVSTAAQRMMPRNDGSRIP